MAEEPKFASPPTEAAAEMSNGTGADQSTNVSATAEPKSVSDSKVDDGMSVVMHTTSIMPYPTRLALRIY